MTTSGIAVLQAFIDNQMVRIEALTNKTKNLEPSNDDKTVHLAYELHNIYCAFEDLFKEIAKTFENEIEDLSQYHKGLLKRMQLEIRSIRPKVISEESYEFLLEMLGFRHVFRHAYNYNLNPAKVKDIQQKYIESYPSIVRDIKAFQHFLENIDED